MCRLGLNKKAKKEAAVSFVIADIQTIVPSIHPFIMAHKHSEQLDGSGGVFGACSTTTALPGLKPTTIHFRTCCLNCQAQTDEDVV